MRFLSLYMMGVVAVLAVLLLLSSFSSPSFAQAPEKEGEAPAMEKTEMKEPAAIKAKMSLTSRGFGDGGRIPRKFTCDGANISPPLSWNNLPAGTKSLALIVHDPDARVGNWTHWVIYNIPPYEQGLEENTPAMDALGNGVFQGMNSFRFIGYGGPCPPVQDEVHHYIFTLYALNDSLPLAAGEELMSVERGLEDRVISSTTLTGLYDR